MLLKTPRIPAPALRRTRSDRILEVLFYAVVLLLVAGIVHIVTLLALPKRATQDAYAKVAAFAAEPLAIQAGPPVASQSIPYRDPAMATTYCRYDLANGPVRVSIAVTGTSLLALSLHSRYGRPFYALTGRSASHGVVALVLMTAAQAAEAESRDDDDAAVQDLKITAPDPLGFVQVQALAVDPTAMAEDEAAARKLSCTPATPAPAASASKAR